jgi:hypothetical protein
VPDPDGDTWAQADPFADEAAPGRGGMVPTTAPNAQNGGGGVDEEIAEFMALQHGKGGAPAAGAAGGDGKPRVRGCL